MQENDSLCYQVCQQVGTSLVCYVEAIEFFVGQLVHGWQGKGGKGIRGVGGLLGFKNVGMVT